MTSIKKERTIKNQADCLKTDLNDLNYFTNCYLFHKRCSLYISTQSLVPKKAIFISKTYTDLPGYNRINSQKKLTSQNTLYSDKKQL